MDFLERQKELEKQQTVEQDNTGISVTTYKEQEQKTEGDDLELAGDDLLVQLAKNQTAIMKTLTQISKQVEDFRKAWTTNQRAGKF